MIKVTVKGVADIGRLMKDGSEKAYNLPEGSSFLDLLEALIEENGQALKEKLFPDQGSEVSKSLRLMINGRDIAFLNGLKTELYDGDRISIIPMLGGG